MDSNRFQDVQADIQKALVDTTRSVGQIANEDLPFQCASNPAVTPLIERQKSRLLGLVNDLTRIAASGSETRAPIISDADAIEDKWRDLTDVFDRLLEKADVSLDEYTGVIKKPVSSQQEYLSTSQNALVQSKHSRAQLEKPQLHFAYPPNNYDVSPFKPLLQTKPHALIPLDESLQLFSSEDGVQRYSIESQPRKGSS